ncbi:MULTISPECIES: cation diffusion facilitator family transporter [Streptomyces]|uniref:cation diffusion facilitator family transporter n=1 Tax=Streptomyces TaxID=1883 RepID=UPI000C44B4F6|nr:MULTISPECIES: cation diffusion facilitator family transporter [Streptomyces]PIB04683.1 cation diffusion facilitator family transporter [Streptomyces sp. HG99]
MSHRHHHEHGHEHGHDHSHEAEGGRGHGHSQEHETEHGDGRGPDHGHGQSYEPDPHPDRTHQHPHGRHPHPHPRTLTSRLRHLLTPHSHETADKLDSALESSARGMRALWVSLAVLGATALAQAVVVVVSGSVALLGDTVHNAADALTAVPLGIAFVLGRRAATRRFTYGYGRAEDLAGIVIVLTIAASGTFAACTALDRLLDPRPMRHIPVVAAAALIGFLGNEWVARHRIRVGREIGSAALVADGLHARTDGFTSLAVLVSAAGAALGWQLADPLVGLAITAAIVLVLRDAAREVFRRVMDAVDPELVDRAERALRGVEGVRDVGELRLRWIGHRLRGEVAVVVDGEVSVRRAHHIAVEAEHALLHAVPKLTAALVHADPTPAPGEADPHLALAHHAAA